jgi:hypothetical protein
VDIIFSIIREDTFWSILLFIHFLMAVALPAAVTLQAASVLTSARQAAGNFIDRFSPVPAASYATVIVLLYMPQASWARGCISSTAFTSEFLWSNSATGGPSEPSNSRNILSRWALAYFRPIGTSGGSPCLTKM